MAMYIHSSGIISPQGTWVDLISNPNNYSGSRLTCVEPEYANYVDPKSIRRMSRIIKMGVASAAMALNASGTKVPDAIITATGYGCLEDTGNFLTKLVDNKEEALNPTPFIQSTHNTIGSQIALLLQCQGYNQTYTQRGFSFENALIDAMMQLDETEGKILIGAVDEITGISHTIQKRFSLFRETSSSLSLFEKKEGTLNGEGSAFFLMSGSKPKEGVAVSSVNTFFKPDSSELLNSIRQIVSQHGPVDFVLSGRSGDQNNDSLLDEVIRESFSSHSIGYFKHLCGEYPVVSSFAMWLGMQIIESQTVPKVVGLTPVNPIRNVLIFNQYLGKYYSLIYLTKL